MRTYFIKAEVNDDIFSYWTAYGKGQQNISKLINILEGSERLQVGDIISIEFDTQKLGFERNLQEDYNAYHFKIDHKVSIFVSFSNDELALFEEHILIPIPKVPNE